MECHTCPLTEELERSERRDGSFTCLLVQLLSSGLVRFTLKLLCSYRIASKSRAAYTRHDESVTRVITRAQPGSRKLR